MFSTLQLSKFDIGIKYIEKKDKGLEYLRKFVTSSTFTLQTLDDKSLESETINILSEHRKKTLIQKYLNVLGLNQTQFIDLWKSGDAPDTYETLRLASLLRL